MFFPAWTNLIYQFRSFISYLILLDLFSLFLLFIVPLNSSASTVDLPVACPLAMVAIGLQTSNSSQKTRTQLLLLHSHHLPWKVLTPMLVSLTPNSLTLSLSPQALSFFASSSTQLPTKTSIAPKPISQSKQAYSSFLLPILQQQNKLLMSHSLTFFFFSKLCNLFSLNQTT